MTTVTEVKQKEREIPLSYPELKNKKLFVRIWSGHGKDTMPRVLATKKIRYGSTDFSIKIGGKDRYYKINYKNEGLIKMDNKRLYYDVVWYNSLGALSFYEFPEDMDSEEAFTTFKNNAVKMYVQKGGIPLIYLMVAMCVALVGFIAIIAVVPSALQAQEQVKQLDTQITLLRGENAQLKAQLSGIGSSVP